MIDPRIQVRGGETARPAPLEVDLDDKESVAKAFRLGDRHVRQNTRGSLARVGKPAIDMLVSLLSDRSTIVRWEAAKILREIAAPESAPALVQALRDDAFGVRWLAAEALRAMGRHSLEPLLIALIDEPRSDWLRWGAHHVARRLRIRGMRDELAQLVRVLEGPDPSLFLPPAAQATLNALRQLPPDSHEPRRSASKVSSPT